MNFYNPYQQNTFPNPMPQRAMYPDPQYPQPMQQSGMVWVKNRYEAENFPANFPVALWDSSGPYVHRKEIDASGRPVTRTFKLVEVSDTQQTAIQAGDFITRQEFQAFVESLGIKKEASVNE